MKVHLIDGTYELFRQYYGQLRHTRAEPSEFGATRGVVRDVVSLLASGSTYVGVATDHVIESFRNDLWPGYKTSAGMPAELLAQFGVLEESLEALGVKVWAMVELEADDALASAAAVAARADEVEQVLICTPDKDLAQCVIGDRVVQVDRRALELRDEQGVWEKFGVAPESIPDWLALVGDSADGFPGLSGWGKRSASVVLSHYVHIDAVPADAAEWDPEVLRTVRGSKNLASSLARDKKLALLFRELATLRVDTSLLQSVDALRWKGPTSEFEAICTKLGDPALAERVGSINASS